MSYRDDRDAQFARFEAVLRENHTLRDENSALRRALEARDAPVPRDRVVCWGCGRENASHIVFCLCGRGLQGHLPWTDPDIPIESNGELLRTTRGEIAFGLGLLFLPVALAMVYGLSTLF